MNGNHNPIAGTGKSGYADNAATLNSQFFEPTGIAVLGPGEFLVADTGNHVVRYVNTAFGPGGGTKTVAGTPKTAGQAGNAGKDADKCFFDRPLSLAIFQDTGINETVVLVGEENNADIRAVHFKPR
jgi:hypothetical protein